MKKVILNILELLSWIWTVIWLFLSEKGKIQMKKIKNIIIVNKNKLKISMRLNFNEAKNKLIHNKIVVSMVIAIVFIVIASVNASNKHEKSKLNTYNNIIITSNIEGLEITKEPFDPDRLSVIVKLKEGYVQSNNSVAIKDLILEASIKYPNKTREVYWNEALLRSDGIGVAFDKYSGAESIVLTKYTGIITTEAQKEAQKEKDKKQKLEDDAIARAKQQSDAIARTKQEADDKVMAEQIEKNRYEKISDIDNTQTWRVYVEAGRDLGIYGNAGNQLVIIIRDESGNPLVSDMLWNGAYDKSYTLSNIYNGYYTVELSYISQYVYNWKFQVE
ncbi:hypothetical protein [Clostridium vincentii]|nr:hypothetical protein [Clostridium vincentii]